jgi:predicted nucleic acid-binding protein
MVFLDTSVVIYSVEQPPGWGQKATARLGALRGGGDLLVVTEIVRMECLVGPIKAGDTALLAEFAAFFAAPDVVIQPITMPVAFRAATIRASFRFQPMDSLHLAAAVEHGCRAFLTNDARLSSFPDIAVEILT